MLIKNLTKISLSFNQSGKKKNFKIAVDKAPRDYPVSLKDKEQNARLKAMRGAKMIAYGSDLGPKPKVEPVEVEVVKDVRATEEATGGTRQDGNPDTVKGRVSRSEKNESK